MTSTYAGTPLDFSFTGTFGSSHNGNFTSNGTHGNDTWSGSGTWSFTPASADRAIGGNGEGDSFEEILRLFPDRQKSG